MNMHYPIAYTTHNYSKKLGLCNKVNKKAAPTFPNSVPQGRRVLLSFHCMNS